MKGKENIYLGEILRSENFGKIQQQLLLKKIVKKVVKRSEQNYIIGSRTQCTKDSSICLICSLKVSKYI